MQRPVPGPTPRASAAACRSRVLIIDRSSDTREVLRVILEQRGIEILEATEAGEGLALAQRHQPDVIVVDLENTADDPGRTRKSLARQALAHSAPLVVLGTWPASSGEDGEDGARFVRKPYHYGPLVRKIEELLGGSSATASPGSAGVAWSVPRGEAAGHPTGGSGRSRSERCA